MSKWSFDFSGRVAVVTGGASGIGEAIAGALAECGATVCIADINRENAEKVAGDIQKAGGGAEALEADVSDAASVDRMVQSALAHTGRLDIMVNSAGVTYRCPAEEFPEEEWDRVVGINLKGTFLVSRAAAQVMLKQGKGKIVLIASMMGKIGNPLSSAYSASKGGVINYTHAVAAEWASRGVCVNTICPGFIKTALTAKAWEGKDEYVNRILGDTPMARFGLPEDLLGAALFLASPMSDFCTGQSIVVDGAYSIV